MGWIYNKISTLLLMLAFVLTTLTSIPGFAWCFGEDGHFEIEYVATGDCGDGVNYSRHNLAAESSVHFDEDHCGPCLDLYIQPQDATTTNRLNFKPSISPDLFAFNNFPTITPQTVKLLVGDLVPQPPPRISQTILEHRTTVLLN